MTQEILILHKHLIALPARCVRSRLRMYQNQYTAVVYWVCTVPEKCNAAVQLVAFLSFSHAQPFNARIESHLAHIAQQMSATLRSISAITSCTIPDASDPILSYIAQYTVPSVPTPGRHARWLSELETGTL